MAGYSIREVNGQTFVEHGERYFRLPAEINPNDDARISRALEKALLSGSRSPKDWMTGVRITLLEGLLAEKFGAVAALLMPRRASTIILLALFSWGASVAGFYALPTALKASRLSFIMAAPLPHQVLAEALFSFLLVFPILFWHELGHLAFARSRRIGPSSVGMTTYLVLPAFYTRVRYLAALPRWDQAGFFLSGIYFQGLLSLAILMYLPFDPVMGTRLFALNVGVCALNVLPVLKLDGYQTLALFARNRRLPWWLLNAASLYFTTVLIATGVAKLATTTFTLVSSGDAALPAGMALLFINLLILASLCVFLWRRLKVIFDRARVYLLRRRRLA
jgi:hypothetical protein